ncbi:flagellar biosynthetic protein FliR [Marivivens donghaensis]|uniref:Flagellar biosynthetic protein FliR n=1 Tax=Marivivens donghaensis TaxID=1699413 RepID=A0ABX0VTQ3_9RHOB|nr:flagellar biosynthetic protein FliR [Marivivens donghaensis]NIY70878.1 flagellar biosynthetic protein FliR [Marivivens donghaensis]
MEGGAFLPGAELTDVVFWITQFFFLSLRIGAFLLAGPGFGGRYVPLPVRIVATIVMTLPLVGNVPVPTIDQLSQLSMFKLVGMEIAIGLGAGILLTTLFGAAAIAGDRIANTAGLGFAAQLDPSAGGQTPVVAQIFGILLLLIFIGTNGHLTAFRIILESYTLVPPMGSFNPYAMIDAIIMAGGQMFALAARIMMPVVAALLLINIMIGVFTRSAPQLNVFSFGFPVTMTATIVLLFLTVPGTAAAFDELIHDALSLMSEMILEVGRG